MSFADENDIEQAVNMIKAKHRSKPVCFWDIFLWHDIELHHHSY